MAKDCANLLYIAVAGIVLWLGAFEANARAQEPPAGDVPESNEAKPEPASTGSSDVPAETVPAAGPRGEPPELTPTQRPGDGRAVDDALSHVAPPSAQMLDEGSFVSRRRGWLEQVPAGGWMLVFDGVDASAGEPQAMPLLPCQRLMEMVRIVQARPETATFNVSGTVYTYRGRNHLLPTTFATVTKTADAARAAAAVKAAKPAIDVMIAEGTAPTDPTLAELIEQVEKRGGGVAPERPTPPTGVSPEAGLWREGSMIVSQRGRLVRGGAGWMFAIDNDADAVRTPEARATPASMMLLACQNLELMEQLVNARTESLSFTVSGPVFTYRDRNYLLPTMFVLERDREGNLLPAQ